jgi:hypothetical protein
MKTKQALAAAVGLMALAGTAQALSFFEGRLADGTASSSCSVSGADKCTMFYAPNLGITILNDWNLGKGFWSETAAAGSAQALAESGGFAATGLTGWVLPTGDGRYNPGLNNQLDWIWTEAGGTFQTLVDQFDGVQSFDYWSGTEYAPVPGSAWYFGTYDGFQDYDYKSYALYAVAVRPGDVVAAVPEPQTWAMLLLGLGVMVVARRRRPS